MEKIIIIVVAALILFSVPFILEYTDLFDGFSSSSSSEFVPTETAVPNTPEQKEEHEEAIEVLAEGLTEASIDFNYSVCLEKEISTEKNFCIKDKAIEFRDVSGCELADKFYGEECLKKYALGVSDKTVCDSISNKIVMYECYSELGIQDDDASSCLEIPIGENNKLRSSCLKSVAINTSDMNICVNINFFSIDEVVVRDSCISNFYESLQDESFCSNIFKSSSKQDCLTAVAKNKNSIEICQSLSDEDAVDDCLLYLADELGNFDGCELIIDEFKNSDCLASEVDSLIGMDFCNTYETNSEKNNCIKDLAVEEDNLEFCELIEGDFDIESECYKEMAELRDDSLLCRKILASNFSLIDECNYNVAVSIKETELCENILSPPKYLDCFAEIANELDEVSICNAPRNKVISSYSNYNISNLCIMEFSIKSNSTDFCDRITQDEVKVACNDLNSSFR